MNEERMSPHQHLQAVVSEWADDYILIARVGDQTAVTISDAHWAREIMDTGQVDDAIASLAQQEAQERGLEARRHHGAGQDGPRTPDAAQGPQEAAE